MHHVTAAIAAGAALSPIFDQQQLISDGKIVMGNDVVLSGLYIPSSWTAANISFSVSNDGVNFSDLFDAQGTEYVVTAIAGKHVILDTYSFKGVRYFKIRSGTSGTPVNQVSQANVIMAFRSQ